MSQACQQMDVEEQSRHCVVINTHKGLFRSNHFQSGVSSAPGILQQVIESLLSNIPGVVVYLQDILITNSTDEDHFSALEQVLQQLNAAGL